MGNKEDQRQAAHDHKNPTEKPLVFFFHSKVQGRQFHPKEERPNHPINTMISTTITTGLKRLSIVCSSK